MRAQAQFTIHTLNDIVTSKTAPASPYLGQLWVDTNQSPPITKVWNGSAWKEQNGTDTIRTSVKTVETKASNLETNLNGLTSTVSLISKTVETIESDTAEAQENILDLQSSVSTLEQTASDIELRVTKNEDNISSLTVSHNSVAARVKTAEGNITTLKADVSGLKTRVSNAEGDITTLEQDVDSITTRVTNAEGDITEMTADISGLTTRVGNAEGNITTLKTSVNGLTTRVTNAEGDISTLEQSVRGITTRVGNAEGDISSLEQSVSSITTRVSNAEEDVSELTTDLSGVTTRVSSAEGKITTLTTTVNGIKTRVTNAEGDISSLEQSVSSITTRVSSAEGAITTLEQTTDTLSASVTSKADWTGGNQDTFGWTLSSDGFYLYANGVAVMEVTESGLTVIGSITANTGTLNEMTITGRLYFGGNSDYYIDPNYDDGSYYISIPGLRVDDASGAVFSGRLSAPSGTIGGFTITTSAIYKTKTSYSSTTAGVYIGTDGIGLGAGTFYVTSAGALTAKSGTIGGFTIGTSSIYKTKTAYNNTTAGVYVGTDGIGLGAGTFYVTSAGALTAKSGTIGGFTIGTSSIYKTKTSYSSTTAGVYLGTDGIGLGAGTFYVTSAGALTATNATVTGAINATSGTFTNVEIRGYIYFNEDRSYYLNPNYNNGSWYIYLPKFRVDDTSAYFGGTLQAPGGTIGGFTISTSSIYKSKTSYSSSTAGVYIGTDGIGLGAGTFYVTSAGAVTASNVKITGGSIALGASNNQNYLSMTSSRILFGVMNEIYTQINWSGITVGIDQWYVGTCNRVTMGAFGGADTGISSFGIHSYLDPDGDNIFTISAEDTDGSYMGSGYIELRIGTTYSKCYGYLGSTWKSSSSITVSSDRDIKNSIEDMPAAYSTMFDKLRPVIFKYNEGTSGRFHTGFIAQEVAEAVESSGLTLEDFAAVCAPYDKDGVWGIRYSEIVALNTSEIQKLKAEIAALKAQLGGTNA